MTQPGLRATALATPRYVAARAPSCQSSRAGPGAVTLDKRIMHQLQVPAPGRRKRARPLGTGQKDPEFEKFRGASARLVQVRSSEHVRKDEIQRPQDDADRRMLRYPFDWGHVHRAGIAKYHRCSIPDAPGSNACRYLCGPGSGLRGAVCMSGPSSGPFGWGGTLAGFRKSQSPHATMDCATRRHRRSSNRMDLSARLSTLKDLVSANGSVGALSG